MGDPKKQPGQQRKMLRIGIIQGGRITEERLIPHGAQVTIGDGQKNTFVLHSAGLPKRFPLFTCKSGQYYLAFTGEMDGKLSMDGGVVMGFDSVRAKSTRLKDGSFRYPVTQDMRGKVSVAGATLLFQFVPPAVAPVKRGRRDFGVPWYAQIDTTFVGIFAASFVTCSTIMLYSLSLPRPPELTLEQVEDRFARIIAPKIERKAQEQEKGSSDAEEDKEEDKEEKKPEKVEEPKDNDRDKSEQEANSEADKPKLSEAERKEKRKAELKQVGILKVLGSKFGQKTRGGIRGDNIFESVDTGAGLGDLIDRRAKGIATASTAERFGLRATSDTSLIGSGEIDGVSKDTDVKTETRVAKKIPKTNLGGDSDVFGSLNKTTMDGVIKKNLPAVNACYDKALKLNPNIQGKIYIDFTVSEVGRISYVEIRTTPGTIIDDAMIACIKTRVRRWRFPKAEEGATDVSVPIVLTAS